ncbi:hypothetical protein MKX01_003093 [Papaver californicum]|nr:hypothetical protein MKX01_003093 [Papaver californicum]
MATSALLNGNLTLSSSYSLNNNTFKSRNYNFFVNPSNISTPVRVTFKSEIIRGRRRSIALSPNSHTVSSCTKTLVDVFIDLKLPRRSLTVQFTCNQCGEKTKRLVNPLAYERGTLIDNLGLIVEYDFRKDDNMDLSSDLDRL